MRTALFVALLFLAPTAASAHCEVPCGIYGDKTRIDTLYEHVATIEKAMTQIGELAGKTDAQSVNQCVRWINTKEAHATEIQHIVSQYFMTQRLKVSEQDLEGNQAVVRQLILLQNILRGAMKTKQTVDPAHAGTLREQIDGFCALYFNEDDLKHIREHHGKHAKDD